MLPDAGPGPNGFPKDDNVLRTKDGDFSDTEVLEIEFLEDGGLRVGLLEDGVEVVGADRFELIG